MPLNFLLLLAIREKRLNVLYFSQTYSTILNTNNKIMKGLLKIMKIKKKKLIIGIVAAVLAVLLIGGSIALYAVSVSIYDGSFSYRCDTSDEKRFELSEFPSMSRERHTFKSNDGQTLVGYLYEYSDTAEKKGVVVFAHGLGAGGQCGYMDIFDYFCLRGYYVFAYDATANDESEGEVIGGLPQGTIDLDYAINYAKTIDEIKELPFVLMGYSWGGMSVVNVLNYQTDVEAVASLAGWNKSMNMIEYRGCEMVGGVAKLLIPFASLYEYTKYGNYAFSTAMKGFENTDCPVMIVHGEEDDIIPIEYSYDTYYKKYGEDDRFIFKKYENRDHEVMTTESGKLDLALMDEVADFFDASIASK